MKHFNFFGMFLPYQRQLQSKCLVLSLASHSANLNKFSPFIPNSNPVSLSSLRQRTVCLFVRATGDFFLACLACWVACTSYQPNKNGLTQLAQLTKWVPFLASTGFGIRDLQQLIQFIPSGGDILQTGRGLILRGSECCLLSLPLQTVLESG